MIEQSKFAIQMLMAIRRVAEDHDQHINRDPDAVVRVVDAVARSALAVAVGGDPKATAVMAVVSNKVVTVFVRHGDADYDNWQELIP